MARNTKYFILFLLIGTLVSLFLLAVSFPNLQLHSGTPFPGRSISNDNAQPGTSILPARVYSIPVLRGILAIVLLIGMFYLPARLISHVNLKLVLKLFLILSALIILAYVLPNVTPARPAYLSGGSSDRSSIFEYPVTPLGQPPPILIQFVIGGVVLGAGILFFIIMKRWSSPIKIETELLQKAEHALDSIQAGIDLRNVVIRCYLQMTQAIQKEQGIERNDTMTAREFEDWLEQRGFPIMPVHRLTSLFEKVRYSKQRTGNDDEKIAVDSLNEIIQFCRSGKA